MERASPLLWAVSSQGPGPSCSPLHLSWPGTQELFNNHLPRGWEDERMNLPLLTSLLISIHPPLHPPHSLHTKDTFDTAPSHGPLHVLLPLPAVLCPSSPSLSLCPLPGHSYPFLRCQHKHPSLVSLCTSPSMRLDVYMSDHFHSTCLYLKPPSLCEHVLTISLLTIPPGSLTISCTDSPHAPSRSVWPMECPPSSGWTNQGLCQVSLFQFI